MHAQVGSLTILLMFDSCVTIAGDFPKSVCTSVNECICHGIPDSRRLEDGDIINIDVTVYLNVSITRLTCLAERLQHEHQSNELSISTQCCCCLACLTLVISVQLRILVQGSSHHLVLQKHCSLYIRVISLLMAAWQHTTLLLTSLIAICDSLHNAGGFW